MKGIILKDDMRYTYTEKYLCRQGHIFYAPGAQPEGLDFMIFPFKEEVDQQIYNPAFFASLGTQTFIFSGTRSPYLTDQCKKHQLSYYVMMEDRGIAIKNAVPTSEGVIAYLISNRTDTLSASRILIIGYGTCGRDLAKRLRALDADVYALVRNREKECMAAADAVTPVYLNKQFDPDYDIIINTVPKQILNDQMLNQTKGALLIDISSKPYGFPLESIQKLNEKSALLPGIPGKYATRTSGEILGGYINFILNGRI